MIDYYCKIEIISIFLTTDLDLNFNNENSNYAFLSKSSSCDAKKSSSEFALNPVEINDKHEILSFCKYCVGQMCVYQIGFDEAVQLCTNTNCLQYNKDNLTNFNISSCLIKRDYKLTTPTSLGLKEIQFNDLTSHIVQIENNLINIDDPANQDDPTISPSIPINTKNEENVMPPESSEMFQFNLDNLNIPSVSSSTFEFNNNSIVNDTQFFQNLTQFDYQIQDSMFNDTYSADQHDLFSDLDEDLFVNLNDMLLLPEHNDITYPQQETPLNHQNDITIEFSETSSVAQASSSDLTPQIENNFKQTLIAKSNQLEKRPKFDLNGNEIIACATSGKSGKSSILIKKLRPKTPPAKLKVIEDKKQVLELGNSMLQNSASNVTPVTKQPIKRKFEETILTSYDPKEQSKSAKMLLPWEKSSKESPMYKKSSNLSDLVRLNDQKVSKSTELISTPQTNNRFSSNLITKADLSQKTSRQKMSLKEAGSDLRRALMGDQSFLTQIASTPERPSNASSTTTGIVSGYKDLILNVLKKKNNMA